MRVVMFCLGILLFHSSMAESVFVDAGRIILSLETEPPNLDSALATDTTSSEILRMTNEGLVFIDRRGNIVPGVAERWQQEPDAITFYLRDDAFWSNGEPVTAQDFVYAARRLVDPVTGASGSLFLMDALENAGPIIAGEMPPEALGVRAIDERTLHVTLSRPARYAIYLFAVSGLYPLNQSFVEAQGDRYAADAENLLSNGPFIIEKWVHSASLELVKNPHYWNADKVQLNEIDFGYITSNVRSRFNLFKSNQLAALELDEQVLKDVSNTNFRVQKAPQNCLMYIDLNQSAERPLSNLKLRRAIRLAIDRDRFVNNIVGMPGVVQLDSIYTNMTKVGEQARMNQKFPVPEIRYDLAEARRLVEAAKKEMGVEEIPPLVLVTREQRALHAEFIQSQLRSALGLEVRVDIQTFKQYLVKINNYDFDLTSSGFCGGAFADPIVYAGIFTSNSPFNRNGFSDKRFDELVQLAESTADDEIRANAFNEAQQIIFDKAVIIPTHQLSSVFVQHPRLAGIRRYPSVYYAGGYLK